MSTMRFAFALSVLLAWHKLSLPVSHAWTTSHGYSVSLPSSRRRVTLHCRCHLNTCPLALRPRSTVSMHAAAVDSNGNPSSSISNKDNNNNKPSSYADILLFNSQSNQKELFVPSFLQEYTNNKNSNSNNENDCVRMYTCGPTVYDFAHVGNFRAFLTYDVLKRTLHYFGYAVTHVCNLTDVDDKIIAKCIAQGIALPKLTLRYEELFMRDLSLLNIVPATHYPRATQHIPEMVTMIETLRDNGLAYQSKADASWYFRTANDPMYGKRLVNLNVDEMEQQQQQQQQDDDSNEDASTTTDTKEHWQDFCLWKAAKPGEQEVEAIWDTSLGKGRPGWHIECSAMARKYLGDNDRNDSEDDTTSRSNGLPQPPLLDIHCGGQDLKFPHHENEIAQSEGAMMSRFPNDNSDSNGGQSTAPCRPFCNCWIHNGFVNVGSNGDEKMSKSLGNFVTLQQACPTPMDVRAYRYLVVSSHYRTALNFTPQAMVAAKRALQRMDKVRTKIQDAIVAANDSASSSTTSEEDKAEQDGDDSKHDAWRNSSSEIARVLVPEQIANFEAALKDDLSMPRAAACVFALVKAAENEFKRVDKLQRQQQSIPDKGGEKPHQQHLPPASLDIEGLEAIFDAMDQMDRVFGIFYTVPGSNDDDDNNGDDSQASSKIVPEEVMSLVGQRTAAKDAKDWELADSLRARIKELGFAVKDVKDGEPIVSRIGEQ